MIEGRLGPVCRCVALGAILPELAFVGIIITVAGSAGLGRTGVHAIAVAVLAGDLLVLAFQRKSRKGVVEGDRLPALG